jgi:DNA-binding NarL/FixJ family response regulator
MEVQAPFLRVLLVSEYVVARECLSRLLAKVDGIEVTGQSSSTTEALEMLGRGDVNVVLIDLDLGIEPCTIFLRQVRGKGVHSRVLVLAAQASDAEAAELIRGGAGGIFLQRGSPEQLVQAIRKLAAGEHWLDSAYVGALIHAAAVPAVTRSAVGFTERERQVLRAVMDGLANKQIGTQLRITDGAVKNAVQRLFHKTGVRTRAQLVHVALERRLDF